MGLILWTLIGGTIVGLLGKMVAPGNRENVPLWLTILCGIGGILIGNWAYGLFFDANTPRFDWWRHGWQIAVAAVLVYLVAATTGRRKA